MSPPVRAASFADKNVGNGKAVSVSGINLGGGDGRSTLQRDGEHDADITAKALTVSATGVNKVYDGTSDATV
jgi:hypothetical protein